MCQFAKPGTPASVMAATYSALIYAHADHTSYLESKKLSRKRKMVAVVWLYTSEKRGVPLERLPRFVYLASLSFCPGIRITVAKC
jgi:hypothetical protein